MASWQTVWLERTQSRGPHQNELWNIGQKKYTPPGNLLGECISFDRANVAQQLLYACNAYDVRAVQTYGTHSASPILILHRTWLAPKLLGAALSLGQFTSNLGGSSVGCRRLSLHGGHPVDGSVRRTSVDGFQFISVYLHLFVERQNKYVIFLFSFFFCDLLGISTKLGKGII